MVRVPLYHVDAFTREPFGGNPAGVVLGAEVLSDRQMQLIARELNHSETAFVLPGPGRDVRVRFFTPETEVPSCGHATIAAHRARAEEHGLREESLVQHTLAGPMPIEIFEGSRIRMVQAPPTLEPPLPEPLAERVHRALGLRAPGNGPVQVVSTGHSKVLVPVASREDLEGLAPDMAALTALSRELGCNGYFAFTLDSPDPGTLTRARMFAPAIGIPEDPVTGNGHGPLGAYLVHHGLAPVEGNTFAFRGTQGDRRGRSGAVDVGVELEAGRPTRVAITGEARILFRTTLEL